MTPESYDVPIMIDIQGLAYEDIAKLNPFYEEYKTFWDDPRDAESSLCSDGLSSSPSLPSIEEESEPSLTFELAKSPLFPISALPDSPLPETPKSTYHDGGHSKPTYEHHSFESSQVAIVEHDEFVTRPFSFSPEREQIDFQQSEASDCLDPVGHALGRVRSSHKQLFGEGGWLGPTAELDARSLKKNKYKSIIGLGKKFKQHVGDMAVDMVKTRSLIFRGPHSSKVMPKATLAISLDPTAQAKLYSEMEVMICVSANRFLVEQYDGGRISNESIRKVNSFWGSKNRPNVVEFQFDQATQRQLILYNIRSLHFNGESSTNPILLHSNLQNWKAIVKEMSVRTFCAPDSVIRKHMHDIQKLLDMLGAPIATFLAFEELQMRTLFFLKEQRARNYLAEGGRTLPSTTSFFSQ
ncbi:hypothetical protein BJY04DRAFT_214501 [Aspergillus karnatakaensis]|uniref:uncharacterized protein n=1 Tax=Aspergillus karnatakaensis TaxID=1810916 RepID=UPI003CCD3CC5